WALKRDAEIAEEHRPDPVAILLPEGTVEPVLPEDVLHRGVGARLPLEGDGAAGHRAKQHAPQDRAGDDREQQACQAPGYVSNHLLLQIGRVWSTLALCRLRFLGSLPEPSSCRMTSACLRATAPFRDGPRRGAG